MDETTPVEEKLNSLLREDVRQFIAAHEGDDVRELVLKKKEVLGIPASWIADQITGRRKAKHKLPEFYRSPGIVFPPSVNLEQSSSEATAKFKESLVRSLPEHTNGIDVTAGFGVDAFYLSRAFERFDCVEPDSQLIAMAQHNHAQLAAANITYHNTTAESFLDSVTEPYDFLYIDPSRRQKSERVFKLEETSPDVVSLSPVLLKRSRNVLVKASPLLDLKKGAAALPSLIEIIVVAVDNECKELLLMLGQDARGEPLIRAVDLDNTGGVKHSISFKFIQENEVVPQFSPPLTYLYEPNNAILKAGAFKWTGQAYTLFKLAQSTHLYTSDTLLGNFPGRTFKIIEHVKLDESLQKRFSGYANIMVRNHPLSVEDVRKRTGLKEGGQLYLICARTLRQSKAFVCERIS